MDGELSWLVLSENVGSWLAQLFLVGGSSTVIAYGVFRWLGSKWIETKFARQLESARHDNAKELEQLKVQLDSSLKNRLRLEEKRFQAILAIWTALKDAQGKLLISISPLKQYPSILGLRPDKQQALLRELGLTEWQTSEVLEASDRQKALQKVIDRCRFNDAAMEFNKLDQVTRAHELFFEPALFTKIRDVCDKMHSSLVSRELAISEDDHAMGREAWMEYSKECVPLISELVAELRSLLGEAQ